jgi:hypothetical protein
MLLTVWQPASLFAANRTTKARRACCAAATIIRQRCWAEGEAARTEREALVSGGLGHFKSAVLAP